RPLCRERARAANERCAAKSPAEGLGAPGTVYGFRDSFRSCNGPSWRPVRSRGRVAPPVASLRGGKCHHGYLLNVARDLRGTPISRARKCLDASETGAGRGFIAHPSRGSMEPGKGPESAGATTKLAEAGQADTEVPEHEAFYRFLVESSNELVVLIDSGGRLAYASPSFRRLFGTLRA